MNPIQPIYTEINNCQDCYKCVRWCPVKSIKVEKNSASIINEQCIYCGRCTLVCPAEAKKVRNDLRHAQSIIQKTERVIASIAPSYLSDFPGVKPAQMIRAIKQLGFSDVSETALGAELVSKACRKLLQEGSKSFYISSACPSVVELIQKYYPEFSEHITPFLSPMGSHGKMLRQFEDKSIKIIFFSPCIAKKSETDKGDRFIDVALTFHDLKEWFAQENINPLDFPADEHGYFFPENAASASMYPVDGGMINSIKDGTSFTNSQYMAFSGIGNIKKVLRGIEEFQSDSPMFLELLACEGGCINGPGATCDQSLAQRRFALLKETPNAIFKQKQAYKLDISYSYANQNEVKAPKYTESEITEALQSIAKLSINDELNCGGCGYDSCRDFAHAFLDKKAEESMCVSYMRRVAHNKANALLQKIPSGVVMVNDGLKIIESNKNFATILGEEFEMIYDINPGLEGADLQKTISFHKLFASVLQSGEDILERDVRENGKMINVSIFSIQKHKVVCGLFRDMYAPEVRRDEVIKRTKKVINENLSTVQQIAFLLGENASRTEAMLNSIVDSYTEEHEEE